MKKQNDKKNNGIKDKLPILYSLSLAFLVSFMMFSGVIIEPITGTTILRPNASASSVPYGWSGSSGTLPMLWWTLVDESISDGDISFIWKQSGRTYNGMRYQNLSEGENPPPNENVVIDNCTIYMKCKDSAHSTPSCHSTASIEFNGWSILKPTYYPVTGLYTNISSYWMQRWDTSGFRDITVSDVNNAWCDVTANLGLNVYFRFSQTYIEVNWTTII